MTAQDSVLVNSRAELFLKIRIIQNFGGVDIRKPEINKTIDRKSQ